MSESARVFPLTSSKNEFYAHIHEQLRALLDGHRFWVSNLAQVSALLYHSYLGTPLYGLLEGGSTPVVNWCGFYVRPAGVANLVLGPYAGRPACVTITPKAGRGVCADAYVGEKGVVVTDVEAYPGHIGRFGSSLNRCLQNLTSSVRWRDQVGDCAALAVEWRRWGYWGARPRFDRARHL